MHYEPLLHVLWMYSSEQLHGLIETLAGLQFLLGPQRAFQENQAHPEEDLHPWNKSISWLTAGETIL